LLREEPAVSASNLGQARKVLEKRQFSALVIDQVVLDMEPEAASV
jgi:hypothetical protein